MRLQAPCYVFHFGMYKGRTIWDIEETNPSYILWCACNIPKFRLRLKEEYPELRERLVKAYKALSEEQEAWAYTGGRMPTFNSVYARLHGKGIPRQPVRGPSLGDILADEEEHSILEEDDYGQDPF